MKFPKVLPTTFGHPLPAVVNAAADCRYSTVSAGAITSDDAAWARSPV
jgi:hypothetical protein